MPFPAPYRADKEFSKDEMDLIHKHVEDHVYSLKSKTENLRNTLLPKWVRNYKGTPATEKVTFPWPNASNLVVQVSATHCDELLSRIMSIYQNDPLFVAKIYGDYGEGNGDDERDALETFLSDIAVEPESLDLYRVEETWWSSAIRYGTGVVCFPWEYITEQQYTYFPGASAEGGRTTFTEIIKRDGPHPENVPLNMWLVDPEIASLGNSAFVCRIVPHSYLQMIEKKERDDIYDKEVVSEVIMQGPDRYEAKEFQREQGAALLINEDPGPVSGKWDIYECWYKWRKDGQNFRLVTFYHERTHKFMGTIFNMYPMNLEPFEDAKLAYDDDTYYGYGFAEMLEGYQKEISTTHNQRIDNRNLANTGMFRINPNSKLSSILTIYPGVLVPALEGEIEALNTGSLAQNITTDDEQLTLALASARAGVTPSHSGAGAAATVNKKGAVSASGTAIQTQSENNRNNLRTSDMKSSHTRLGRKLLNMYAAFGLGNKIRQYGDRAENLARALESYRTGRLGLAIKPASASVNKELEKQNDILLSTTLERVYAGDAQIIQALAQPGIPEELKEYWIKVFFAKNSLYTTLLRSFDHADTDRLLPVPKFLKDMRNGTSRGNQKPAQAQTGNVGTIPISNGQIAGGIPQQPQNGGNGESGAF